MIYHAAPCGVLQIREKLQPSQGLRQQEAPIRDVASCGDDVEMAWGERQKVIEDEQIFCLLTNRDA